MTRAIDNLNANQSRWTTSIERLANSTAERFNDDGVKKIGNIIKQIVCNASTTNGADPAPELTPFAKDILSLTGDQPLTHINILFQKNKVRAKATPKFIAAARKGLLTYDNGIPNGLSLTQLPQTLQGTEIEQLDIARLLNMEANGTITEQDTLALNKDVLPISRTMHYLQDKTKAWSVFCTAYFGESSYFAIEAERWHTWMEENFNELQEIKATTDRLPVKIEIAVSDNFNRSLRTAMLGVPDESVFQDELRKQILNKTAYLHIPHAISDMLDKSNKRSGDNTGNPSTKRAKTTANKISHDNQPRDLFLTPDQYRSKALDYIKSNKDKLPKFDNSTEECLKYTLLGYCNNDCPRKKSHCKVNKGTTRFNNLLKFKNNLLSSNPSRPNNARQDFQQGE